MQDFAPRTKAAILSLCVVVIAACAMFVFTGTTYSAESPVQPDYQRGNTIQNIFENHLAWRDYTDAVDAAMFDENTPPNDLALYLGDAYSASMNYLQHLQEEFPTGNCAIEMWLASESVVQSYTNVYGALYFQMTAEVGDPIDWEHFLEEAAADEEWSFNNIPQKCINKLDK